MLTSSEDVLAAAIEELGGQPREGQTRMTQAVAEALESNQHLAVQAGTGTGKSFAYLVPAAIHATDKGLPVVISTATIALQRQLVERDLPRLAKAIEDMLPRPLEFAILKGRNNYLCLNKVNAAPSTTESEEAALLDPGEVSATGRQVARLHEWAQETEDGDRDNLDKGVSDRAWRQVSVTSRECIGATRCPFGKLCFAEQAKYRAQEADIVVTNHALLAIDALSESSVLPEHEAVIVDEAHELEGRITNVATAELSGTAVAILAKRAGKIGPDDAGAELKEAGDEWVNALEAAVLNDESAVGRWTSVPSGLEPALTSLRDAAWSTNRKINQIPAGEFANDPAKAAERLAILVATEELNDTCVRILNAHDQNETTATTSEDLIGEDVVWLSNDNERKIVRVAPLSVADLLRQKLFGSATVVLTSATLALGGKFNAMLNAWGIGRKARTLDVGTPFDAAKHGILYVAQHLPPPGRSGASNEAVDEVAQLINAAGGRTLGLFSSRRAAEEMANKLRSVVPHKILLQGEDSLAALVEQFREDESTCLFGTLGLWQGVDVPGRSLSLVIMDRIPFPRPDDPLRQARKEAADSAGRNGFMEVAANHAALLMAQGAGRLLRSTTDRGVVAVLDSRLATARYGSYIRASMPGFWETSNGTVVKKALRRLVAD
ncbi:ATP-dependent DNA helicase [Corynebacterium auriscanis]|uniref:ATP-dependent DNA helicase n=1 Tax=Corynebacterium auriscanis TaxID=99807 RepID=UPI003CF2316E